MIFNYVFFFCYCLVVIFLINIDIFIDIGVRKCVNSFFILFCFVLVYYNKFLEYIN